ncbi:hypothetical protein HNR07_004358 [Nocardiopsis metallicus]|uniref:Uncharacterized protein n=1 Tax=Nocardiopsis metallicus TaxID=179819 RepID=A0A840WJR3_9ACTN|nr:hypothetical protein [Nocardiopsis metallicus]
MRATPSTVHTQVVAAEVMVMPCSRSSGRKSMAVVPSWTSPTLWETPV